MPVEKNAFMAMARKALEKPYYLDENGQKVEYDETYYINDEEIVLPPLTEEQLNQAVSFVESIGRTTYQNSEVLQIINEEVPAFFEGLMRHLEMEVLSMISILRTSLPRRFIWRICVQV